MCRFGIPKSIVSNNGPQFDSQVYRNFCHKLKIKILYSTPRYPQSNGLVEASNKTLLTALKKRFDSAKGKWVDELPEVLWAYRTTARKPTGISPFTITFGMEAIIPMEIGMPTIQTNTLEQGNTELMIKELENTTDPIAGKFQPNWEGPYLITQAGESEAYALDKLNGTHVPIMWNATHLKRYYQ